MKVLASAAWALLCLSLSATGSAQPAATPGPAPAPAAPAAAAPAAVPAPSPSAPSASPPNASTPSATARGAAVVLVGPASEEAVSRARLLARKAYQREALRPAALTEPAVQALVGTSAPGQERLSELRAGLVADLSNAATQALLASLANELPVRTLLVLIPRESGAEVRVVHVTRGAGGAAIRMDPAVLVAPSDPADPGWDHLVESADRLAHDSAPPLTKPAPAPAPPKPAGPRKDQLAKAPQPAPEPPPEESSFFESPWFWVAVGGVAAAGISVLVVSQVTDVGERNVALSGRIAE